MARDKIVRRAVHPPSHTVLSDPPARAKFVIASPSPKAAVPTPAKNKNGQYAPAKTDKNTKKHRVDWQKLTSQPVG